MKDPLCLVTELDIAFVLIEVGVPRLEARKYAEEIMQKVCGERKLRRVKMPLSRETRNAFYKTGKIESEKALRQMRREIEKAMKVRPEEP